MALSLAFALARALLAPPAPDHASVVVDPPEGWLHDSDLAAPDLTQTPQSRVSEWHSWKSPTSQARLVAACFETPTSAWAAEVEPFALDKMTQFASSTAIRLGLPGELASGETTHEGDVVTRVLRGDGDGRAFLAFTRIGGQPVLTSCFALCADRQSAACEPSVSRARIDGPVVHAPEPNLGVHLLLNAIHHPSTTAAAFAGIVCLGLTMAVLTRKRPRRRRAV